MKEIANMKIAVVTASTKGIGRAIGLSLLADGCFVCFNYSSDDNAAHMLDAEIRDTYKDKYMIVKADMSNLCGLNHLYDTVHAHSHHIDYLVLNAGITDRSGFTDITPESWNKVMDTNLNVPLFTVQKFSQDLRADGRIIFIGAMMGQFPHAISLAYGVSKAALQFLTQCLVKEFCDERKITVNCIVPGFVDTPWQKDKDPEHRKRIEDKTALHRFAYPEEIADICLSVMGNAFMTGSIINIDGGYNFK
jgi:3-oxoacyl-[acyl-carrier protein] reductase